MKLLASAWRLACPLFAGLMLLATAPLATAAPAAAPADSNHFDYWMLSLAWSPEYCRTKPSEAPCKRMRSGEDVPNFFVYSMLPRLELGTPPRCEGKPSPMNEELLDRRSEILASPNRMRKQWREYGTCSGSDPDAYLMLVERAYRRFEVPKQYRKPNGFVEVDLDTLRRDFLALNPGFDNDSFALICSHSSWLSEVRVCFDSEFAPRSCGLDIEDRCTAKRKINIRPPGIF